MFSNIIQLTFFIQLKYPRHCKHVAPALRVLRATTEFWFILYSGSVFQVVWRFGTWLYHHRDRLTAVFRPVIGRYWLHQ